MFLKRLCIQKGKQFMLLVSVHWNHYATHGKLCTRIGVFSEAIWLFRSKGLRLLPSSIGEIRWLWNSDWRSSWIVINSTHGLNNKMFYYRVDYTGISTMLFQEIVILPSVITNSWVVERSSSHSILDCHGVSKVCA